MTVDLSKRWEDYLRGQIAGHRAQQHEHEIKADALQAALSAYLTIKADEERKESK